MVQNLNCAHFPIENPNPNPPGIFKDYRVRRTGDSLQFAGSLKLPCKPSLLQRTIAAMGISDNRAIWKAETDGFELLNETIADLLDRQAAAFPDHEALVYNYPELGLNIRCSYRQYR